MRADFDDLTGVLVAHNDPGGSGEAAIIDMQIAAADIRRDEFQDDRVLDFSALWILELGIAFVLDLHSVPSHKGYCAIAGHELTTSIQEPHSLRAPRTDASF